jgi:predicted Zn-dependent peptidase
VYRVKTKNSFVQIETDRFKDCIISLRFFYPNLEPYVTTSNLLSYMMSDRTANFSSKQLFHRRMDELYGLYLDIRTSSMGLQHCLEFRVKTLNAQFLKDLEFSEVIDFLDEVIHHPLLNLDVFNEAYINYHNALMRSQDKPQALGLRLALEAFGENLPISNHSQGKLSVLKQLSLDDVQTFYRFLIQQSRILVYHGYPLNQSFKAQLQRFQNPLQAVERSAYAFQTDQNYENQFVREVKQTTLTQIYQTNIDYHDARYIALRLMTIMLGQMPNSLLFQEIREKRSLCYSIGASGLNFDGLVLVQTGYDQTQSDLVETLIEAQIKQLQEVSQNASLLKDAKKVFMNGLKSLTDDPYANINYVIQRVHEGKDIQLKPILKNIQDTTLEEIAWVASQLKLVSKSIVKEQSP